MGVRDASVERSGSDDKALAPSLSRAVARAEYQTFVAPRRIAAKSAGFSRQLAKAGPVRFHFGYMYNAPKGIEFWEYRDF